MLAYVFWHQPKPDTDTAAYETALRPFHERLAASRPTGFSLSVAMAIQLAPWLPSPGGYEDWYLVEGSAALDVLDSAAVSGGLEEAHDAAAAMAGFGTAGLYKLADGDDPAELAAPTALWFDKPRGMTRGTMLERLKSVGGDTGSRLWQRKMTLGPTPEFCLLKAGPDFLPYEWKSTMVVRQPVYVPR